MKVLELSRDHAEGSGSPGAALRSKTSKVVGAVILAFAMVTGMSAVSASADDGNPNPTPGPTIIKDPNSPTGYTGHFVY